MLKRIGNAALAVGLCAVACLSGPGAWAANVTMVGPDGGGASSFNSAGRWSNGQAPSAGNAYFTSAFDFRTPATDANFTFAGDSLSIDPGSRFIWKSGAATGSTGRTITVPALIFNGGQVFCGNNTGSYTLQVSSGSISVNTATTFTTDEATGIRTTIIPSALSGTAPISIVCTGAGQTALTLSGANTDFSGGFNLNIRGILNANSAASLGSGILTINGGTLNSTAAAAVTLSTNPPQNWNSDVIFTGTQSLNMGTGAVALSADRTVTVNANTLTVGPISGAFSVSKAGAGTLAFGGANTNTGTTVIGAGTLRIVGLGSTPNTAANLITVNANCTLNLARNDTWGPHTAAIVLPITVSGGTLNNNATSYNTLGPITLNGGTINSTGGKNASFQAFGFKGPVTVAGSSASTISGSGTNSAFQLGQANVASASFDVGDVTAGTDLLISGVLADGRDAADTVFQPSSLIKTGTGTMTLSGANTYTGATINSGGAISVSTLANGGVPSNLGQSPSNAANLVFDGGTLQYTGMTASTDRGFTIAAGKTGTIDVAVPATNATFSGVSAATSGSLLKTGPGTLTLTGANTYSGSTRVDGGTLSVSLLANGGTPSSVGQSTSAPGNLVLNGTTLQYTGPSVSTNRGFTLNDGTTSFLEVATAATNLTLSGASAATTGALTKTGPGTLTFSGVNSYTGATTVSSGRLFVNGVMTGTGSYSVGSGAILGGTGTIPGPLSSSGGIIKPGTDAATGKLTLTHATALTMDGATSLNLRLSGAASAVIGSAGNDGIEASTGAVNLGGAQINVSGLTVTGTTDFHVLHAGSLTGTVTIASAPVGYTITPVYDTASTPKALILHITQAPVRTWKGLGANGNWSTAANWDIVPAGNANETLIFPAAPNKNTVIDATYTGKSFGALVFQDTGYVLTGTGVTIKSDSTKPFINNQSGTTSIQLDITLASDNSIAASGGTLTIGTGTNVILNGGFTLTLGGSGTMTVNSIISGTGGLTHTNQGSSTLAALNTYIGKTTISNGTLNVATLTNGGVPCGIGAAVGANRLEIGAGTLRYTGAGNSSDRAISLTGPGTVDASGSGALVLSGGVSGTAQNLVLAGSGNATESSSINLTTGSLTKTGTGTWTLPGINIYSGTTSFNGGVLSIAAAEGIGDGSATNTLAFNTGTLRIAGNVDLVLNRSVTLNAGGGTFDVAATFNAGVQGVISGTGSLTKLGGGTLALGNVNTNSGVVNIFGGAIGITGSPNLGDASPTNALNFDGGTLAMIVGVDLTPARTVLLSAGGGTFDVGSGAGIVSGVISGTGVLTKAGSGALALTATNVNSNAVKMNGGVLSVAASANLGDGGTTNVLSFDGGSLMSTATLNLGVNRTIALNAGGGTLDSAATFTMTVPGIISGAGNLNVRVSNSTVILSGTNTYTGATSVDTYSTAAQAGVLRLANASALGASSGITVNNTGFSAAGIPGTTLDLSGGFAYQGVPLNLNAGQGNFRVALVNSSGSNVWAANITVNGGAFTQLYNSSAGTFNVTGNITAGAGYTGILYLRGAGTGLGSIFGSIDLGPTGSVGKTDSATFIINSSAGNNWVSTLVQLGILRIGAHNAIPPASTLIMSQNDASNCSLDLNGFNQEFAAIASNTASTGGTKAITNTAAGLSVLTVNNPVDGIYGNVPAGVAVISGNVALVKKNAGILTLAKANSYTGTTTISDGKLLAGIDNALPATTALTIADVATASFDLGGFNQTVGSLAGGGPAGGNVVLASGTLTTGGDNSNTAYAGVISGTGGLTKSGSGMMTLSGISTFTGAVTINAGTLSVSSDANLGLSATTTAVTFPAASTGALQLTGAAFTSSKNIFLAGPGIIDVIGTDSGTLSGIVSGGGTLTKTGTGTLALSGANTYLGTTTLGGGIVSIGADNNLGDTAAASAAIFQGGTLRATNTFTTARSVNIVAANGTVDVTNANVLTLSLPTAATAGSLTKSGSGDLILTGAQGHSGGTLVTGGNLRGNASTLGAIGLTGSSAVFPGVIAPIPAGAPDLGSNPALSGSSINFGASSKLRAIITTNGTITHSTQVNVTGAATIAAGAKLTFGVNSGNYPAGPIPILNSSTATPSITVPFAAGALPAGMAVVYRRNNADLVGAPSVANPADTIIVRVANAGAVTPVKLDAFAAQRQGAGVLIEWTAVSEFKNAGFNVYRRDVGGHGYAGYREPVPHAGAWTLVNPAPIAGRITSADGKKYRLCDWAPAETHEYKLECLDLNGGSETYEQLTAPVTLDLSYAESSTDVFVASETIEAAQDAFEARSSVARAQNIGRVFRDMSPAQADTLPAAQVAVARVNERGAQQAEAAPQPNAAPASTVTPSVGARWFSAAKPAGQGSYVAAKAVYDLPGVYKIPQAALPAGFDTRRVSIQREGRNLNALALTAENELLVFGPGYSDAYTGKDALFLRKTSAAPAGPAPMASGLFQSALPVNVTSPAFAAVDYHDVYFDFNLRPYSYPPWFSGKYLTQGTTQSFAIAAPNASSGPATLTVNLWSLTQNDEADVDHALQVMLNGNPVGEAQWSGGSKMMQLTFAVPSGVLGDGSNQVELSTPPLQGVSNQMAFLHSIGVAYTRALDGSKGAEVLNQTNAAKPFELNNLPANCGGQAWVVDVRFPDRPALLPAETQAQPDGTYRLRFIAPAGGSGRFLVVPRGQERTALSISARTIKPPRLSGTYLAAGPAQFALGVQPLLARRAKEGIRGAYFDQEQLFDYYNYGRYGPDGIRNAVRALRPAYLLLAGRTTYDYRNYSGLNVDPLCPTFLVSTAFWAQATSDSMFGDLGRGIPEVAVGRLPVNNTAELAGAVNHILRYSGAPASAVRVHAAADRTDPAVANFSAQANDVASSNPDLAWQENYLGTTYQSAAEATAALRDAANGGADWLIYIGHGNSVRLGKDDPRILQTDELIDNVRDWTGNALLIQATCTANWMAKNATGFRSIAIQALTQPQGGIAAGIGSSSYMDAGTSAEFLKQLLAGANSKSIRWGPALLRAQQWAIRRGGEFFIDAGNTQQIFGDPAMPVFAPVRASNAPAAATQPGSF